MLKMKRGTWLIVILVFLSIVSSASAIVPLWGICDSILDCDLCQDCEYYEYEDKKQCVPVPWHTPCIDDGKPCTEDLCEGGYCTHDTISPPGECPKYYGECKMCDGTNEECVINPAKNGYPCVHATQPVMDADPRCAEKKCFDGICGSLLSRNNKACDNECHACSFGVCSSEYHDVCEPGTIFGLAVSEGDICVKGPVQTLHEWGRDLDPEFEFTKCYWASSAPEFNEYAIVIGLCIVLIISFYIIKKNK